MRAKFRDRSFRPGLRAAPEGGFFSVLSPNILAISSAEMRCARRASLTRALCFVYSLLITELNGIYLGLAGTFGAPLRDLDGFSSLLSRFT